MPVVKEEIANARKMDLLSYLERMNRASGALFRVKRTVPGTHDSLKISNGKWYWFSQNIGGRSALDCLVKVKEMSFGGSENAQRAGCSADMLRENRRLPRESCFCRYWTPIQAKQRRI